MCVSPEDKLISHLEFNLDAATDREAKLESELEAAAVREKQLVNELEKLVQWIEDDIHRPGDGLKVAWDLIDQYWKAHARVKEEE